ncbi:MAG: hypothetical protein LC135_02265 [Phycisphaerae bacterium]|jgi:hypothetical protein|nr:hypothetical protein [Phycisphaerae bacterium]MCZ2398678.1 hypothetical protein [Phycisphaerae bacterium]NUQ48890.1 hypothetical protein [Phycisphaerae bacterium]
MYCVLRRIRDASLPLVGFCMPGGLPAKGLAVWDGNNWSTLGNVFPNSTVKVLFAVEQTLYIGGAFNKIGEMPAKSVAKWDGQAWSALGNGLPLVGVGALQVWDDGSGSILFAGGTNIYKWNGATWSLVGAGLGTVLALELFDDGSGTALYAGGGFPGRIARWNGATWSLVGGGMNPSGFVRTLEVFDDGTGPALYIGGAFAAVGGVPATCVARWNGNAWSAVGDLHLDPDLEEVNELKVLDLGDGPALYATGLTGNGGFLMKWDGKQWTSYLPEIGNMYTVEAFDTPAGRRLHLGGAIAIGQYPNQLHTNIAYFTPPGAGGFGCGDFDGDGVVTQADLGILLAAFDDCPGPGCPGDANGDGVVDQQDLGILLAHFGQECG